MAAEYPLPSVSASNPQPNIWYQIPEVFQVDSTDYDDGGKDTKLQAGGNGIKRWVLNYTGLDATKAAILISHQYSAKLNGDGLSAYGFNYRDRDATLYANVHYEKFERVEHRKTWAISINVQLVKYP